MQNPQCEKSSKNLSSKVDRRSMVKIGQILVLLFLILLVYLRLYIKFTIFRLGQNMIKNLALQPVKQGLQFTLFFAGKRTNLNNSARSVEKLLQSRYLLENNFCLKMK